MSCERKIITFKQVEEVRIECCDSTEIAELEKTIISAIEQKLEKLNILIKNCNIFCDGKSILVNDRYNICSLLLEVASAFGLEAKQIECSLRGKNYIISDKLLGVLCQFDRQYAFGKNVSNQDLDDVVAEIMSKNAFAYPINSNILSMVRNIKKNGQYVTTRTREVTEDTEDGILVDRAVSEWVSDEKEIRNKLISLSRSAQETVNKTNENLRDGTAKLIYARARQMGYAVQEIKKGTQTQLVLVRCE